MSDNISQPARPRTGPGSGRGNRTTNRGRGPAPQELTPGQAELVDRLTETARARRELEERYVQEALAAHAAGVTFSAIGRAAGVTAEAARKLVLRNL